MGNYYTFLKNAYEMGINIGDCGYETFYDFGCNIDLCGSTPQELMPKPCQCCGGSGSTGSTITKNIISTDITKSSENNKWELIVSAEKETTSDINITIDYSYVMPEEGSITDSETFKLSQPFSNARFILNIPEEAEEVSLIKATLDTDKDGNFEYIPSVSTSHIIYYGVYPSSEIESLTSDEIKAFKNVKLISGDAELVYDIPVISVPGINDMEDENKVNTILINNAYDLIVAYDNNVIEPSIIDSLNEVDNEFKEYKYVDINDLTYKVMVRNDVNSQRNVYDSNYELPVIEPIKYKIKIK